MTRKKKTKREKRNEIIKEVINPFKNKYFYMSIGIGLIFGISITNLICITTDFNEIWFRTIVASTIGIIIYTKFTKFFNVFGEKEKEKQTSKKIGEKETWKI